MQPYVEGFFSGSFTSNEFLINHEQGCTKSTFPGCVKLGEKLRFANILQAGERNFSTPYSHNLGRSLYCGPVDQSVNSERILWTA